MDKGNLQFWSTGNREQQILCICTLPYHGIYASYPIFTPLSCTSRPHLWYSLMYDQWLACVVGVQDTLVEAINQHIHSATRRNVRAMLEKVKI